MRPGDSAETVRHGYDVAALRYLAWTQPSVTRERYVGLLRPHLPEHARVLEIGCGAGIPVARDLAAVGDVTGVDVLQPLRCRDKLRTTARSRVSA